MSTDHPFVGMWVTSDGRIRHALLPDGRYDEARDGRAHAYRGRYAVTGTHVDYIDDTGFTADGDFAGDTLYHAGMVLKRESPGPVMDYSPEQITAERSRRSRT